MMESTQVTKSNLAKLLATENINVAYRNVDTASFDIKNRQLTIPLLNDMTNDMQDLFIGHEVGHALDTPIDYVEEQTDMPKAFKTFLNVIEDARIERKIKDRYPGLRKSFFSGYKEFVNRDFFRVKNKDVNKMLLIDRINLYFKIGPFFRVNFNSIEQQYVKKVSECETFEDVVAVSKELFEYCKDELEQKKQQAEKEKQENNSSDEFEDSDILDDIEDSDMGNEYDSSDFDDFGDEIDGDNSEESGSEKSFSHDSNDEFKDYDEVKSITDENLQQSLKNLAQTKEINNGTLGSSEEFFNYNNIIISYKNILGKFFNTNCEAYKNVYKSNLLSEFESKNKNAISYLVKEFEMRKRAAELRRVVVSDTGTIDTNKLHTYKFNDDIFRKIGSISAGKSHGIVMFLDWSGSMEDNLTGTIEQLITLTSFCRKVSIPFEVYAFSTSYIRYGTEQTKSFTNKPNEIGFNSYFSLLNIFSSRMKNQEYRLMANDLLNFSSVENNPWNPLRAHRNMQLSLGGTPLNETIFAASGIVNRFRKAYKKEIVDVIFLTDGEDSDCLYVSKVESFSHNSQSGRIGPSSSNRVSYIHDKETKKQYRVDSTGVTPVLLQILKDRTGCNLIGFFIVKPTKKHFCQIASRLNFQFTDELFKNFRVQKFHSVQNYGYDEYFLLPGEKYLNVDSEGLTDIIGDSKVSSRVLKGAFLKMNKNRLTNRVLLSRVIEQIA
jgi:hypothetical protein